MTRSVEILFTRRATIGSDLIRALTWSPFSHVDIIVRKDRLAPVREAFVIGAEAVAGVVRRPLAERLATASRAAIMHIACEHSDEVEHAAASQLGKPYDWRGLLGLGVRRRWQDDDKWFCSELVAWAFEQAGHRLFRPDTHSRITPQHLWLLAHPTQWLER